MIIRNTHTHTHGAVV